MAAEERDKLGPKLGSGDQGYTDLLGPGRVAKSDLRIHTAGELDEASSALGLARALSTQARVQEIVRQVQHDLYLLMAEVAMPVEQVEKLTYRIAVAQVDWLAATIDTLEEEISLPRQFILPGASPSSAALDVARTVVRRAERAAVALAHSGGLLPGQVLAYLNRCSSLLFVLARYEEAVSGIAYDIAKR